MKIEYKYQTKEVEDNTIKVAIWGDLADGESLDQYADKLHTWAYFWEWQTMIENIEDMGVPETVHIDKIGEIAYIVHRLDKDDLEGLFNGKYNNAPPAFPDYDNREFGGFVYYFIPIDRAKKLREKMRESGRLV